MAILQVSAYETFTEPASYRRADLEINLGYATAGTSPNALAKGLGIAFFANTKWNLERIGCHFRHCTQPTRLTVDA